MRSLEEMIADAVNPNVDYASSAYACLCVRVTKEEFSLLEREQANRYTTWGSNYTIKNTLFVLDYSYILWCSMFYVLHLKRITLCDL